MYMSSMFHASAHDFPNRTVVYLQDKMTTITFDGQSHLPPRKRKANWITAVAECNGNVLVGDVFGQLSLIGLLGRKKRKEKVLVCRRKPCRRSINDVITCFNLRNYSDVL